jgi:hypothetical protein
VAGEGEEIPSLFDRMRHRHVHRTEVVEADGQYSACVAEWIVLNQ